MHNLNFNKGKASFFTVKERAWHGLGTVVEDAPTSEEAIKLAGLDYKVVKRPVHFVGPDGLPIEVPNHFATVREDTNVPFGVVGSKYEVLQNTEAFSFFDSIVGNKEAIFETAGALGAGEAIFITAKLPDYIKIGKNDLVKLYLFLKNMHTVGAVIAALTPVRIVCQNTLNAALGNCTNVVRIQHRNGIADKMKQAAELMGAVNLYKTEMEEVFNAMAKKPIVDQALKDIIVSTFASAEVLNKIGKGEEVKHFETIISDCFRYAMESDTQQMETTKGTVFGAYNAITGYLQNVKKFKDSESQLVSVLDGSTFKYNQKAFNLCKELL